jgi:hypothetical protein
VSDVDLSTAVTESLRHDRPLIDKSSYASAVPLWFAALSMMIVALYALTPLLFRIGYRYTINYNEGWNTYYASKVSSGMPLYSEPPEPNTVSYPPLSFHICGAAGTLLHDFLLGGRVVSSLSIAVVTLFIGLIVQQLTASPSAAVLSSALWLFWLSLFTPDYVGMDDPQMLGHALTIGAVFVYIKGPSSTARVIWAALLIVLGLFVKHTLVAFPLAITVDIALRRRRLLIPWLSAHLVFGVVGLLAAVYFDGAGFFPHLLAPRVYSTTWVFQGTSFVLAILWPALAVAVVTCYLPIQDDRLQVLRYSLPASLLLGAFYIGGAGTNYNVFFELWITLAILVGVGVYSLFLVLNRRSRLTLFVGGLLPLLFVGSALIWRSLPAGNRFSEFAFREDSHKSSVAFLKDHSGPALCEDLLICFDAQKPLIFNFFTGYEGILTGRWSEDVLLNQLEAGSFAAVQWHTVISGERTVGLPPRFAASLARSYVAGKYIPKDPPGTSPMMEFVFYLPRSGPPKPEVGRPK